MTRWNLKQYVCFLIDVDGVLVRDADVVDRALDAFKMLQTVGRVLILTNNSTRSRAQHAHHLQSLGFSVAASDVVCTSFAAAKVLADKVGSTHILPIGEDGLLQELRMAGHDLVTSPQDAEWVVVGMDRDISYQKMSNGLRALYGGAQLVATNEDGTFPTPDGLLPGAGAMVGAFRGMGFAPTITIGKPEPFCYKLALSMLGTSSGEILMIGDRLGTDILGANQLGIDTLLVLSGISQRAEIETLGIAPTWIAESISSLLTDDVVSN